MPFPFYHQLDSMDCGPTCPQVIEKYFIKIFFGQRKRGSRKPLEKSRDNLNNLNLKK
jgi:hypothetical protein